MPRDLFKRSKDRETSSLLQLSGGGLMPAEVGVAHFFDQAQDRQRQRFNITDDAGAVAARANDAAGGTLCDCAAGAAAL